jgi:hypothetical protein
MNERGSDIRNTDDDGELRKRAVCICLWPPIGWARISCGWLEERGKIVRKLVAVGIKC